MYVLILLLLVNSYYSKIYDLLIYPVFFTQPCM